MIQFKLLKKRFKIRKEFHLDEIKLMFKGMLLEDEWILSDFNIDNESTLY